MTSDLLPRLNPFQMIVHRWTPLPYSTTQPALVRSSLSSIMMMNIQTFKPRSLSPSQPLTLPYSHHSSVESMWQPRFYHPQSSDDQGQKSFPKSFRYFSWCFASIEINEFWRKINWKTLLLQPLLPYLQQHILSTKEKNYCPFYIIFYSEYLPYQTQISAFWCTCGYCLFPWAGQTTIIWCFRHGTESDIWRQWDSTHPPTQYKG